MLGWDVAGIGKERIRQQEQQSACLLPWMDGEVDSGSS